jgi:zinc D-Ala-D-Ala dipeptidase
MRNTHRTLRRFKTLLVGGLLALLSAVAFSQPDEKGGVWNAPDLIELVKLDSTLRLDIRYATTNNFMKQKMYTQARAFLQRPAALALMRAHRALRALGYGIIMFDGYRPWSVTRDFWRKTPRHNRKFVANPAKGSKHNRGCAIDCSLYDVATGKEVEMPSPYDSFTRSAAADFKGGTEEQRAKRRILRDALTAEGFTVHPDEWWHFDYKDWRSYRVLNVPFEKTN